MIFGFESLMLEQETNVKIHPKKRASFFINTLISYTERFSLIALYNSISIPIINMTANTIKKFSILQYD